MDEPRYFDRLGKRITEDDRRSFRQGHHKFGTDYRRVALTLLPQAQISTVWVGDEFLPIPGNRRLYETCVDDPTGSETAAYYDTELEALDGHIRIVKSLQAEAHVMTGDLVCSRCGGGLWWDGDTRSIRCDVCPATWFQGGVAKTTEES